jgi:hypothetical protein
MTDIEKRVHEVLSPDTMQTIDEIAKLASYSKPAVKRALGALEDQNKLFSLVLPAKGRGRRKIVYSKKMGKTAFLDLNVWVPRMGQQIERTIRVPYNIDMYRLNHLIQAAFGFHHDHPGDFGFWRTAKSDLDYVEYERLRVWEFIDIYELAYNNRIIYTYDHEWELVVDVVGIGSKTKAISIPDLIAGTFADLPQDAGGSYRFPELLGEIAKRTPVKDEDITDSYWDRLVAKYDPTSFNFEDARKRVRDEIKCDRRPW